MARIEAKTCDNLEISRVENFKTKLREALEGALVSLVQIRSLQKSVNKELDSIKPILKEFDLYDKPILVKDHSVVLRCGNGQPNMEFIELTFLDPR